MAKFKLKDFSKDISVAIKDAQSSPLKQFVGLEHYDSGEPVITRFTDTSLISSSVKEFKENDILIARRNVYLRRAGIAFFSGLTSGDSIILRIYDDCEEKTGIPKEDAIKILPFILNSNDFWNYANKHADGMNSKRISKDMLYDYEFDLPSLSEQKILADKLWAAYRLKESYKKLLAATDEMVKSQFIEMFGVPANSTKGKRGEELFTFASGKANTKSNLDPSFQYNCYGGNGITGKSKDYLLKDKTIVIGRVGEYCGCVHKTTDYCWITDNAIYLKTYSDLYRFEFIYHMFTMMDFHRFASETGQPKICPAPLLSCHYPIPSLEEQNKFVAIADQADKSKFELRKSIEAIDQVIKSLINN